MTDTGIFKITIDCPACARKLRVPSLDDFVRLRCPHCGNEFEHGVASAEVVSEPADAEVIAPDGLAQSASATPATAPAASDSDFTPGEKVGCTVMGLLLLLVVFAGTWLFSDKRQVVVVEQSADGLQTVDSWFDHYWFYVPESRLFGAPAALARLVGLQSPSEIVGAGGRVKIADVADKANEANDLIIVNQTKGDIYYTALIYGNADKADKNAEQGPIRIESGTAAAALAKTHSGPKGGYNVGCAQAPDESENFQTSDPKDLDFAVLGWITAKPPQDCPNAPPAIRSDK